MPTYSLLGSTGNVGTTLLSLTLSSSPSNKVHAHCRSARKLSSLLPSATASNPQIQIFEGPLSDRELLKSCIRGTRACFLAVAPPGNMPGTTVVSDAAKELVGALEELKAENSGPLPKVVVLSSASTEHRLMPNAPKWALNILYRAFSNVYDDLKVADRFLREKGEDLVEVTFVKPGALAWDEGKGHALDEGEARSPVAYGDLAAGMLEVADGEGGRWDGKSVAVNSRGGGVKFPWDAPGKLVMGLVVHFFPGLYGWLY